MMIALTERGRKALDLIGDGGVHHKLTISSSKEKVFMTFHSDEAYALLQPHFQRRVRRNEPLARHSALHVGGPADLWVTLESTQELTSLVNTCAEKHYPLLITGNSSNIIYSDHGVRGIVAHIATQSYIIDAQGNEALLVAEAGVNWPHLVHALAEQGWGGLEFGVNIPGTLGGSVVSNAGSHNEDIGQRLLWLEVLDARGSNIGGEETIAIPLIHRYEHAELDLSYRHSRFRLRRHANITQDGQFVPSDRGMIEPGEIILRLALTLSRDTPQHLSQQIKAYKAQQRPQPEILQRQAGPLFKDPTGCDAGYLIEEAGLQGLRIGQVQLVPYDANYIMNLGSASAWEVIALLATVHQEVLKRLNVDLQLDIEFQGDKGS